MPANKGIALIVVLWVLVILELVVGSLVYISRLRSKITEYHVQNLQALALAKGGAEKAISFIYTQKELQKINQNYLEQFPVTITGKLGEGEYSVEIVNEESKYNINSCTKEELDKALTYKEVSNKNGIISYIFSRRDIREKFSTLSEVLRSEMVSEIDLSKMQQVLTAFSNEKININSIDPLLIPGLDKNKIIAILNYRLGIDGVLGTKDDRALNGDALEKILGEVLFTALADRVCYSGENYQVRILAKMAKKAKRITAILHNDSKSNQIGVKYWRED